MTVFEAGSIVGAVIGLTEVTKTVGLPGRFAPLVAVGLGILMTFLWIGVSAEAVLQGIIYGLSAAGVYSGTKTVAQISSSSNASTEPADPVTPPTP